MAKTITTRLPDEYVRSLSKIAKIENLDTSGVVRKLLAGAMEEWRKNHAVEMYKRGKFSFGQVAEYAELSLWDVPALLKEKGVPLNLTEEDLDEELKTIRWKKKQ